MRMDLTISVDVSAYYVPGTHPRPIGDGTWEPGDPPQVTMLQVKMGDFDITDALDEDTLESVEEAWIENYEAS